MKKIILLLTVILLASCAKNSDEKLTAQDSLKLKMVKQENVSLYGAPPLIPADHPVEVGEDVALHENGGEACLECHNSPDEEDAPQTLHPERNNCLQCHIPATDNPAEGDELSVENVFKKVDKF